MLLQKINFIIFEMSQLDLLLMIKNFLYYILS